MDIRVLRYFLAVAQEENITRAAQALHIAQPSLSKQIMELERELGKQLIIRGKRKITLTEEGILLRKRAEDIVALVEKTEQEISLGCNEVSGRIAIGGNISKTILKAISYMQANYPKVSFQFYSGDAIDVTERLEHGNLDFAVLLQPIDSFNYNFIKLNDKSLWGVLMKKETPFSDLDIIRKEELLQMPLILHSRIGLQQMIADWAKVDIKKLNIAASYNVVNGSPIFFVENNIGYFLVTRNNLPTKLDSDVVFCPLEPKLEVQYNLIWKRRNVFNNASKLFLEYIKQNTVNE